MTKLIPSKTQSQVAYLPSLSLQWPPKKSKTARPTSGCFALPTTANLTHSPIIFDHELRNSKTDTLCVLGSSYVNAELSHLGIGQVFGTVIGGVIFALLGGRRNAIQSILVVTLFGPSSVSLIPSTRAIDSGIYITVSRRGLAIVTTT